MQDFNLNPKKEINIVKINKKKDKKEEEEEKEKESKLYSSCDFGDCEEVLDND
jgi:hypothetical protein